MGASLMNSTISLDDIYPVGSIYMNINSTNPTNLFGGVWEQIKEQFILGCGDTHKAGTAGGSFTKSIEVKNLPAHSHGLNGHTHSWSGTTNSAGNHMHDMQYDDNGVIGRGGGYPHINGNTYAGNGNTLIQNLWCDGIRTTYINYAGSHTHNVSGTTGGNSGNTTNTGGGTGLDITPPYLAVYIWQRTA